MLMERCPRSTKAEGLTPATLVRHCIALYTPTRSTKAEGLTPATRILQSHHYQAIQPLNKG